MKYIFLFLFLFVALLSIPAYSITHNLTLSKTLYYGYENDEYFWETYKAPSISDVRLRNISGIMYTVGIKSIYIGLSLQNPNYHSFADVTNTETNENLKAEVNMKNRYALVFKYKVYETNDILLLIGVSAGESFYDVKDTYNYTEVEQEVVREINVISKTMSGNVETECDIGYKGQYIYDEGTDTSYIQGKGVICASSITKDVEHDAQDGNNFNTTSFTVSYNLTLLYKFYKHMSAGVDIGLVTKNTINISDTFANKRNLDYNLKVLGSKINLVMNISI